MGNMSKLVAQPLIQEQMVDAVKRMYARTVDRKQFGTTFPALSHQKKPILACADALPTGLGEKALHREVCKGLKLPVPDQCYTDQELREALVGYHFRHVDKLTIATFVDKFGPSKATLYRHHARLEAALKLAQVSTEPVAEDQQLHTYSLQYAAVRYMPFSISTYIPLTG